MATTAIPPVPEDSPVDPQSVRLRLLLISRTLNLILRRTGATTITLNAGATTTTITDDRIGPSSAVHLMPLTENATILDLAPYISARSTGSATITHGSTTATDCTFSVLIG